jgi:arylsulfatase A-like enzyme
MRMSAAPSLTLALLMLVGGCVWSAEAARAAPPPARPDLLVIMPDQMRGDCLSILGHPVVRTPNLDRLARQGALFRRAYSTVPSCIPARFALLTGLYPQTSGVVGFAAKPITTPTLPGVLSGLGYTTALVGRNMHQAPASQACGYQRQILGSTYVDDDDYDQDLRKSAPDTGGIRKVVGSLGVSFNGWQGKPWPLADDLHPTAWIVTQARKLVAETPPAQPLFLTASFYAPHPPLFPPRKYFDACLKADLPAPAHGDWVDWPALSPAGDAQGHRVRLEGATLRAAQAGYFGLIEHLDDQLAPLIADFQARSDKAGRPWVIVVISDHGEMLGDHGYFRKCEPFEGSANIPFIVAAAPGLGLKPGWRCAQPVCLEDVMPTLLELAGGQRPALMDGVSLVPVLRGEDRVIREWLHFEHAPCYSKPQAFHALTDGHDKYIWRPADGTELLFDLDRDPREERDLSKRAGEKLALWRARLVPRLVGRPEGFADGATLIPGRPYPAVQRSPKEK